jgi:hypothetical protein
MSEMGLGLDNDEVWSSCHVLDAKPWVDRGFRKFIKRYDQVTVSGDFVCFNNDACNGFLVNVSYMTGERHLQLTIGKNVVFSGGHQDMSSVKSEEDVVEKTESLLLSLFANNHLAGKANVAEPEGIYDNPDKIAEAIGKLEHRDEVGFLDVTVYEDDEEGDIDDVW